jgi:hypothetical protein
MNGRGQFQGTSRYNWILIDGVGLCFVFWDAALRLLTHFR